MSRVVSRVPATFMAIAAVLGVVASAPASAQTAGTTAAKTPGSAAARTVAGPSAPAEAVPTAVIVAEDPTFAYPLKLRLSDLEGTAKSLLERDLVSKLASAYGERGFHPMWVDGRGLLPRAVAVIAEIAKAQEWGLDKSAFQLPAATFKSSDVHTLAGAEAQISYAVAKYAAHAGGGRVDPSQLSKWLDQKPRLVDVKALLSEISGANDPASILTAMHPKHPGFRNLLKAYLKLIDPAPAKPETGFVTLPPGPRIEPGTRHPDVAMVRQRLGILATAYEEDLYDDRLAAAVTKYMKIGRRVKLAIDAKVRDALNNPPELLARKADTPTAKKLLVNLERWRWLPNDLGELHIWNSLTEFETRVTKSGDVIHAERIIIGKAETQTPIFSDRMEYLVFQPEWGVPNSIKVKQLLPALQEGNDGILDERGMKIIINGKEKEPGDYNWDQTDIRYVPVYQQPGPDNPLGQVKFMFPNKHDVYMHDTPTKNLFNDRKRTYSHGCIRVRNPRKLAELIMGLDQGWGASEVGNVLGRNSKPSNRIELTRPIPVHNTYFTAFADEEGKVRTVPDIYSHDQRISDALDGVPIAVIAERDPALVLERELEEIAPTGKPNVAILEKTDRQKAADRARRYSNNYDEASRRNGAYGRPNFSGYSGVGAYYVPPPPKPTYYYKPSGGSGSSGWRSPSSMTEAIVGRR